MTEPRERDRVSFQEVKKLAAIPESSGESTEEKKENSGIIHLSGLAPLETTPQTQQHASPETALALQVSSSEPDASPILAVEPLVAPISPAVERGPIEPARAAGEEPKKKNGGVTVWVALAAGMALGALVACIFFLVHGVDSAHGRRVTTAPSDTLSEAKAATGRPNQDHVGVTATASGSAVDPTPTSSPPAVQLSSLPSAQEAPPSLAAPVPMPSPSVAPPAGIAHAGPSATSTRPAGSAIPGSDESLEMLMKRAIGATASPTSSATVIPSAVTEGPGSAAGNLALKPAMGAVQGALGTVLPAARYCLGPDDPVSRATITFKSDGSVQSVAVTGDAAGQPAEGCIRSRLMSARVPPFTNPTFTWTVTVRPAS
jgi:hypothetical protein